MVQYIGSGTGVSNTPTTPTHQVGDLILVFAYRDGSGSAPVLPSGYTLVKTGFTTQSYYTIGYKVATATNDGSDIWTNATSVIAHIYRADTNGVIGIGASAQAVGSTNTLTYPALTLQNGNGRSWIVGFVGHKSTNTTIESPPTGMVNRSDVVDATDEAAGHDTNGGVSSWASVNETITGTATFWIATTVEITEEILVVATSVNRTSYYTNIDTANSANVSVWNGIASSRDCSKIFITNNNSIYFKSSVDGGSTWNETTLSLSGSDAKVYCIASNRYSTKLFIIAAVTGDTTVHVYMSIDNGITWTLQATNNNLIHASAIVSSADGSLLVASVYNGYIYTSTDFGVTWTQQTGAGSRNWILNCLAISDDGTKIIASPDNGTQNVYLSTDFGVTWTPQTSIGGHYWTDLSMSADGTKMFAVNWDGADHVYVSTNSGSTWATRDITTTGNNIVGGYICRDGSKMIAMDQLTGLSYYSLDDGVTWTVIPTGNNTQVNSQTYFTSNEDGSKIFEVSELGPYVRNFNFIQMGGFGKTQHPFGWNMVSSTGFIIDQNHQKTGVGK